MIYENGTADCKVAFSPNTTKCNVERCFDRFCDGLGLCLNETFAYDCSQNLTADICDFLNCTEADGCFSDSSNSTEICPPTPPIVVPAVIATALLAAVAGAAYLTRQGIATAASGPTGGGTGTLGNVTGNPLYEPSGTQVDNPLFEGASTA